LYKFLIVKKLPHFAKVVVPYLIGLTHKVTGESVAKISLEVERMMQSEGKRIEEG
jgi:high-affinity nickel permease